MPHHGVLRSLRSMVQAVILSDAPLLPRVSDLASRLFSRQCLLVSALISSSLYSNVCCALLRLPFNGCNHNLNSWAVRMLRVDSISVIERTWNALRAARQCMCKIMQRCFRVLAQGRRSGSCEAGSKWTMVFRTGGVGDGYLGLCDPGSRSQRYT